MDALRPRREGRSPSACPTAGCPPTGARSRRRSRRSPPPAGPTWCSRPAVDDAHQDHRLVGSLARTVWRDALVLHYEIPKWDGDTGARRPTSSPLTEEQARRKVELLNVQLPEPGGPRLVGRRAVPRPHAAAGHGGAGAVRRGLLRREGRSSTSTTRGEAS